VELQESTVCDVDQRLVPKLLLETNAHSPQQVGSVNHVAADEHDLGRNPGSRELSRNRPLPAVVAQASFLVDEVFVPVAGHGTQRASPRSATARTATESFGRIDLHTRGPSDRHMRTDPSHLSIGATTSRPITSPSTGYLTRKDESHVQSHSRTWAPFSPRTPALAMSPARTQFMPCYATRPQITSEPRHSPAAAQPPGISATMTHPGTLKITPRALPTDTSSVTPKVSPRVPSSYRTSSPPVLGKEQVLSPASSLHTIPRQQEPVARRLHSMTPRPAPPSRPPQPTSEADVSTTCAGIGRFDDAALRHTKGEGHTHPSSFDFFV
jgi:hypothetical protein